MLNQFDPDSWPKSSVAGGHDGNDGSAHHSKGISALTREALDDFRSLDGYWNKIVLRDMTSGTIQLLQDLIIENSC